jgi:hypothetical protein
MSNSPAHTELERIAREYDRRSRELPEDFYAWSRQANSLVHTHPVRACVQLLHNARLFPPGCRHILDVGCGAYLSIGPRCCAF